MKRFVLLLSLFVVMSRMSFAAITTKDSILSCIDLNKNSFRYGYQELSSTNRAKYDALLYAIVQFDANRAGTIDHRVEVPWTGTMQELMVAQARLIADVPELWIMASYIPRQSGQTFLSRIQLVYTPQSYLADLRQIDSAYQAISKDIKPNMSQYQKLLILHDGFIDWANYGNMSGANAGNVKGGLIEKRAVCEGFARSYLYLCQRAGLRCMYIQGQNSNGNHAWNFVEVDGKWYMADLTADGAFPGVCGHGAFLRSQSYFDAEYDIRSRNISGKDTTYNNDNLYCYATLPVLESSDYISQGAIVSFTDTVFSLSQLPIEWNGIEVDTAGSYIYRQKTVHGQDSIVNFLNVDVTIPSSIEGAKTNPMNAYNPNLPKYNVLGIRVDDNYQGVIIQNGSKFLHK